MFDSGSAAPESTPVDKGASSPASPSTSIFFLSPPTLACATRVSAFAFAAAAAAAVALARFCSAAAARAELLGYYGALERARGALRDLWVERAALEHRLAEQEAEATPVPFYKSVLVLWVRTLCGGADSAPGSSAPRPRIE